MLHVTEFVRLCLDQAGDDYVFGTETKPTDPDPDKFDCSELVQWASGRLGVSTPDGAVFQCRYGKQKGTLITVDRARLVQGALVFRFSSDPFTTIPRDAHVVVSLGNGDTIEARSSRYGVGKFSLAHRTWTHAMLLPGFEYERVPTPPPHSPAPAWPGRFLIVGVVGTDVKTWQQRMALRGWKVNTDGRYTSQTRDVCKAFQREKGLQVDGVVGRATWTAAWTAPIKN